MMVMPGTGVPGDTVVSVDEASGCPRRAIRAFRLAREWPPMSSATVGVAGDPATLAPSGTDWPVRRGGSCAILC